MEETHQLQQNGSRSQGKLWSAREGYPSPCIRKLVYIIHTGIYRLLGLCFYLGDQQCLASMQILSDNFQAPLAPFGTEVPTK